MGVIRNILSSKEYVVQERDGRNWVDVGLADVNADPDEFDLATDTKTRMVCRKGDKVKEVVWTVDPSSSLAEKSEPRRRQKKQKSPIDAIQDKASAINRDRKKLIDVKDTIDELLGTGGTNEVPDHEEWMYPSMMTGLNKGIGHAFMTGMQSKDEDIAQAGLEMVRGLSGMMNVIPMLATAYAKGKGVNVGLFGMDDNMGAPVSQQQQQPPAQPPSDMIHEHDGGFDVDTIQEEDECEDAEFDDEDDYVDDYVGSEAEGESDIDIHGLGGYPGGDNDDKGHDTDSDEDKDIPENDTYGNGIDSIGGDGIDDNDGIDATDIAEPAEVDLAPFGINNKLDSDESDDAYMTDEEVVDIAEPHDPRPLARFKGLANEDQP